MNALKIRGDTITNPPPPRLTRLLTNREKETLQLIADGHSTKEIASIMYCSPFTISDYRKSLLRKIKAKNMAHLVKQAIRYELVNV